MPCSTSPSLPQPPFGGKNSPTGRGDAGDCTAAVPIFRDSRLCCSGRGDKGGERTLRCGLRALSRSGGTSWYGAKSAMLISRVVASVRTYRCIGKGVNAAAG
jgi:hypothetical protein